MVYIFYDHAVVGTELSRCFVSPQAGFFKRDLKAKTEEEFKRDSWDYVPRNDARESTS